MITALHIYLFSSYILLYSLFFFFFFFNDTATTEIYTLSLHDALPICRAAYGQDTRMEGMLYASVARPPVFGSSVKRSEEHTSELQSPCNLVCRLLLEKKKKKNNSNNTCSYYT